MRNKSLCAIFGLMAVAALSGAVSTRADAPAWMHNLVNATLPAHDADADDVVLYSEKILTVQSADKVRMLVRQAYKVLRPGSDQGVVMVSFRPGRKVVSLRGWCIPAQGKDYEVKEKDAIEISLPRILGSELVSDVKDKAIQIPAADPGNLLGYEFEVEETPMVLEEEWNFQPGEAVKDAKFTLQLPPGWEYQARWSNHEEVKPTSIGNNQWQWSVSNVPELRIEKRMPPPSGIAGYMLLTYFPPGPPGTDRVFRDWQQMGTWYTGLTRGRRDVTPEIKQKVAELTANAKTPVAKMAAIADFVQKDVRYVEIRLGIGGYQPHSAADVFQHRYGDCKDKVTLTSAMLKEAGFDSYYVIINSERGSVASDSPAHVGAFDHAILAVKLPEDVKDASLAATTHDAKLGTLLFFDPTVEYVPFGQIGGYLQDSYGLLVAPEGGELVRVPKLATTPSGTTRKGVIKLDANGNLSGDFIEIHRGDSAWGQRERLKNVRKDADRVKFVEAVLAQSLPNFALTKMTIENLNQIDQPFGYTYSIVAGRYAKTAGNLLLVRPRVMGEDSSGLLETKEPRKTPVIFEGPERDVDTFEISLPAGFEVDDLPPPVDVDYGFASYHSKTEATGGVLKYTRTFEIKELSVPLSKMDDLKKFYRIIAGDERNTAVLKPKA